MMKSKMKFRSMFLLKFLNQAPAPKFSKNQEANTTKQMTSLRNTKNVWSSTSHRQSMPQQTAK